MTDSSQKPCEAKDPVWDRPCTLGADHEPEELHRDESVPGDTLTWGPTDLIREFMKGKD